MADEIDKANAQAEQHNNLCVQKAREEAASIPAGYHGECDLCGEYSSRLVDGACAPCRDKYKL